MVEHLESAKLESIAKVTAAPVLTRVDRTFELPRGLYLATVGLYLGCLGVMSVAFLNPELAIPIVIIAVVIIAGFGVAAKWANMQPDNDSQPLAWGGFRRNGIATLSGRLTARQATVQVLILPVLIFAWAVAVAVIAALAQ